MLSAVCVDSFVTASRSPVFFRFFLSLFPRLRPDSLSSITPAHALSVCAIPPRFFPLIHLSSAPNSCPSLASHLVLLHDKLPAFSPLPIISAQHLSATPFPRCQFLLSRSISFRAFAWPAAPTPCFSHQLRSAPWQMAGFLSVPLLFPPLSPAFSRY